MVAYLRVGSFNVTPNPLGVEVETPFHHSFIIYDANLDGDNDFETNTQYVSIIRGGPGSLVGYSPDNVLVELDNDVTDSQDWEEAATVSNYVNLNANLFQGMQNFAFSMGSAKTVGQHQMRDTGIDYDLVGPNSNSVINSVLNSQGIDFRDVLPQVSTTLPVSDDYFFPGHLDVLDGSGNNVFTAFNQNGLPIQDHYTFYDRGGEDYIIIENGASANIKSLGANSGENNIVLSGYSSNDYSNLYLTNDLGDLEVYSVVPQNTVVDVEDHFYGAGESSSKYLFVTSGGVTANDIDIVNDTINTHTYTKLDLELLDGLELFFNNVKLENIQTVSDAQPDIVSYGDDDFLIGDDQSNDLTAFYGSDHIFGGDGNDILRTSSGFQDSSAYVDGGDGFDLIYTNYNGLWLGDGVAEINAGEVLNVEGALWGATISSMGWTIDASEELETSDYSYMSEAVTFNFNGIQTWSAQNASGSVLYTNIQSTNGKVDGGSFVGSNNGDVFNFSNIDYLNNGAPEIELGSGNDQVNININGNEDYEFKFTYTSGNDVIDFADNTGSHLINSYTLAHKSSVWLDNSINASDVSFSKTNATLMSDNGHTRRYNVDQIINISGKGSITIKNVLYSHVSGEDNIFGTSDDDHGYLMPTIYTSIGGKFYNAIFESIDGNALEYTNDAGFLNFTVSYTSQANIVYLNSEISSVNTKGGNDTVYGTIASEHADLGDGDDIAYGHGGDDVFEGNFGNDNLIGQAGSDTLYGGGGNDTLNGGDGNDLLYGQNGADVFSSGAGDDQAYGGLGDDRLYGHEGDDDLYGDKGADLLVGGTGDDVLVGGEDNDRLYGNEDDDFLNGGSGADLLHGGSGNDQIDGGSGADRLYGFDGNDLIDGGADNDRFYAGDGNDTVYGGTGHDVFSGENGDDILDGEDGADRVFGNAGNDTIYGGAGNDVLNGGDGSNHLYSGEGSDRIYTGSGNDIVYDDGGSDRSYDGDGDHIYQFGLDYDRFYDGAGSDLYQAMVVHSTVDVIYNFSTTGADADVLDISNIIDFQSGDNLADYLAFSEVNGDTIVSVDRDGSGGVYGAQNAINLDGLTGLDANTMITNGTLIV